MKDINSLFSDVYDLQRLDLVVDTRLVVNDGEVAIHWHWPELELTMSFCSQEFLCPKLIKHYTVIEDTEVTDDILKNNSESE